MKLQRLKEILALADDPKWQMRDPDQQVAPAPEPSGASQPNVPGAPMQGQPKQQSVKPEAMQRAADQMLLGGQQPKSGMANANPVQEQGPGINLSDNIRIRKMMRQGNPSLPGQIKSGGF